MGTKGPEMTDVRNLKWDTHDVVYLLTLVVSICGTISGGMLWLHTQLSDLKAQNVETTRQIIRIEKYLNMPLPEPDDKKSWTLPEEPDLSKELKPLFPQTSIKE